MEILIKKIKNICKDINEDSPFVFKYSAWQNVEKLLKEYSDGFHITINPIMDNNKKMLKINIQDTTSMQVKSFLINFF